MSGMKKADNQRTLGDGDCLYLFESNHDGLTRDCLILGHAGWVPRIGEYFNLPQRNITLRFRVPHELSNPTNPRSEIGRGPTSVDRSSLKRNSSGGWLLPDPINAYEFRGGQQCRNYVVKKYLGRHFSKKDSENRQYTYRKLAEQMVDHPWGPHIVSVSNSGRRYMLLSEIIALVLDKYPGVTTFVFAGCRGEHPNWHP